MLDVVFSDIEKYRKESLIKLSYESLKTFIIITIITITAIFGLYIYLKNNGGIREDELVIFLALVSLALPIPLFIFISLLFSFIKDIEEEYSLKSMERIFKSIKNIDDVEIISYTQKTEDPQLINIAKNKYSNFDTYRLKDIFLLKHKDKEFTMFQAMFKKWRSKSPDIIIFQGLIFKTESKNITQDIEYVYIQESDYIYIFIPLKKQIFKINLLRKISSSDIERIIEDFKVAIKEFIKYIQ